MSSSEPSSGPDGRVPPQRSVDSFLEAKLHWPRVREGWVDRHRLLDLFDQATRRPVCLVAAPAGYGKTTLTAQWLASRRGTRTAAWVSLDAADNDPGRLWAHVATALERAGCALAPDVAGFMAANSGDLIAGMLPRVVTAMAAARRRRPDPRRLPLPAVSGLPRAGGVPDREPPGAGPPRHHHPRGPGPPAGPAARLGPARRDPRRAAELHRRGGRSAARRGAGPAVCRGAGAAHGPDRGLAGRRLPRRPVVVRPPERRRARPQLQWQRPVRHQLLLRGGAQPGLGAGPRLHPHHVDPRPLLRAAVRRGGRHDRTRPRSSTTWSAGTCSWSRWTAMGAGSGSTTCSPRWPGASWRPGTPTGCRSCTSARRSGTEANGHIDEAITHLRAAGLRAEAAELVQANWLTFVDAGRAPTVLVVAPVPRAGTPTASTRPRTSRRHGWPRCSATKPGWLGTCSPSRGTPTTGRCPTGSRSVESALA